MRSSEASVRITAGMGRLLAVAGGLVVAIGLPLYLVPQNNPEFFAWTVQPPLSAAFLGGAYLSAGVMEFSAARTRLWAEARVAVPAVMVFTLLTSVVTLGNLGRFHFDAPRFVQSAGTWAWLGVYLVVPPIMVIVLWTQVRRRGSEPGRVSPLPRLLRGTLAFAGIALLAGGVILLLAPEAESWMWPWTLTPLTGRAIGAWLVGFGVAMAHVAWEADWRRVRPATASVGVLGVLQLVAVLRYLDEPAWEAPQTWVYMAVLGGLIALGVCGWRLGADDESRLATADEKQGKW